jgi:hypothetical protein
LFIPAAACAGAEIVSASNSVAVQASTVMQARRAALRKGSVIMAVSLIGILVLIRSPVGCERTEHRLECVPPER